MLVMKKFKSILAVAVAAAFMFSLASCDNSSSRSRDKDRDREEDEDDSEEDDSDDGGQLQISVESEANPWESNNGNNAGDAGNAGGMDQFADPTQIYYDYVAEQIVPEVGLADISSELIMEFGNGDFQGWSAFTPKLGLLSVDVRDYNGDGTLDLMTYTLTDMPYDRTSTGMVMTSYMSGYSSNYLSVTAKYYTLLGGDVVLMDQVDSITEISGDSVGTMIFGVYDDNGVVYIYGSCDTETDTTYGPRKTNIYHVEGDSFVFDATQGRYGFGQGSVDGDINVLAGANGVDFGQTAMGTALTKVTFDVFTNPSAECNGSVLGGFKSVFYENMQTIKVDLYDLSLVRDVLDSGLGALSGRAPMPVFEAPNNVVPEDEANALAGRISDASGVALTQDEIVFIDGGGVLFKYSSDSGVTLGIRYTSEGVISVVEAGYDYYDPIEDWYSVKDAVLQDPGLAIDPSLYSTFLGHCDWNQTSTGNDTQSVVVARMDNVWVNVSFH